MEQSTVLNWMKAFLVENDCSPDILERLAETKATEALRESIEALEFLMYLEDKLGSKVNANEIGPALANMTFGELAAEICRQANS